MSTKIEWTQDEFVAAIEDHNRAVIARHYKAVQKEISWLHQRGDSEFDGFLAWLQAMVDEDNRV